MRAAFVALVGRPSAGKSTLVNTLCGRKVSIVSPVPQTTRAQVRGIANRPDLQVVLLDTPGIHHSERKFNLILRGEAERALEDADFVLYILDSTRPPGEEEKTIRDRLITLDKPLIVVMNKIDLVMAKGTWDEFLAPLPTHVTVKISALTEEGIDQLWDTMRAVSPESPAYYPEEYYTDQEPNFRAAEIIREQAFLRVKDELPHAIYVEIADLEDRSDGAELWIRAFITVERESQVGILVGKGASLIKEIRVASQKLLQKVFERKVTLDLRVKTQAKWRSHDGILRRMFPGAFSKP